MNYRYRIKGVAEKAFILRGMHFRVGSKVDTLILESEVTFIKERCRVAEVEDLSTPRPMPNSSKTTKGVTNELPKSTVGANKSTSKAKV